MDARPTPSSSLADFVAQTAERDQPGDVFELETDRMLEVNVRGRVWAKLGSMVAYRGQLSFKTLLGRGGSETFQMRFEGTGFVVVQPFEEVPAMTTT